MVFEQTSLHGLVLSPRRRVRYSPLSREGARELFIRFGLLDDGLVSKAPFVAHNRELVARLRALEARLRRPILLADEQSLVEFYDQMLDPRVLDRASFEGWWRRLDEANLQALNLDEAVLLQDDAPPIDEQRFPANLSLADAFMPIQYRFEPGKADDGITITLPVEGLAQLDSRQLNWLVPGMLTDKVCALLRGLPKRIRRRVGPSAQAAEHFVEQLDEGVRERESLNHALQLFLRYRFDVEVPPECWTQEHLQRVIPEHLRVRIAVVGGDGEVVAAGRDLAALQRQLEVASKLTTVSPSEPAPSEQRSWTFGAVEPQTRIERAGARLLFYPALADTGTGVRLIDVVSAELAHQMSRDGLLRLFFLHSGIPASRLPRELADDLELTWLGSQLPEHPLGAAAADAPRRDGPSGHRPASDRPGSQQTASDHAAQRRLFPESLIWLAADLAMQPDWHSVRDGSAFATAVARGVERFDDQLHSTCALAIGLLRRSRRISEALSDPALPRGYEGNLCDMREQLAWLMNAETFGTVAPSQLLDLERYLEALELRLQKLLRGGARDGVKLEQIAPHWARYVGRAEEHRKAGRRDPALQRYRWMLEEYRISIFAQEIGTATRVSKARLDRLWDSVSA